MKQKWIAIFCFAGSFVLLCAISSILPLASFHGGPWYSPDEQSNKLFTQIYAETGQLSYEKDYLASDSENMLHMRGLLTYNGRAVPFNFLGLPILYGTIYRYLGDYTEFIYILFALIIFVYLTKLYYLLFKHKSLICPLVMAACMPLLFYLNSPYFNVVPAITFSIAGGYYLTKYAIQNSGRADLVLGSLLFGIAIFCQYYYLIFLSLLTLVLFLLKHRGIKRSLGTDIAIYSFIVAVTFVLPVLILNNQYYGSPLQYGYSLMYEVYLPQQVEAGGVSLISLSGLKLALFPSPIDPGVILRNIIRYWFYLMPLYSALAIWGTISYIREKRAFSIYYILFALLAIYIICYRGGDAGIWGQDKPVPVLGASILRYWLLLYIAAVPFVSYGIERIRLRGKFIAASVIAVLLITGLATTLTINVDSLDDRARSMLYAESYGEGIAELTEEDAIIYCGRSDKAITAHRDVATWWIFPEFEADKVAQSMTKVKQLGYPVYLIQEAPLRDIEELNSELSGYRLTLVDKKLKLYKLETVNATSESP